MNFNPEMLIDLIYTPITSGEFMEVIDSFGVPKPLLDKSFKDKNYSSIPIKEYGVELFYSDISRYEISQIKNYNPGEVLYSGIQFSGRGKIEFPFGIDNADSIKSVCAKLGKNYDHENQYIPQKSWIIEDKKIVVICYFTKKYESVQKISVQAITRDMRNRWNR